MTRLVSHESVFFWRRRPWSIGDYESASVVARSGLANAQAAGDFVSQVLMNFSLHQINHSLGNHSQALSFAQKNVDALAGELMHEHFGLFALPSVMAHTWLTWSLAELGQFEEAASIAWAGMQFAEEYDQPISTLMALWGAVEVAVIRGCFEEAVEAVERAAELCKRWDFKLFSLWTSARLGHVYALSGRVPAAIAVLQDAVPAATALPGAGYHSLVVRCPGEAFWLAGQVDEALDHAQQALTLARQRKERGHEAWTLRLLGEINSDPAVFDAEAAEPYFDQSRALAEELHMRPLLAHCKLGLGILHQRANRHRHARIHLRAAAALFEQMGMQPPPGARVWLAEETPP